ncbi:hypothetical protein JW930_00015 [Candidatus Woesearchaeota archaeon]|nr:hypothetical protein [Candidatus Woesearchaeota archaeon]
MNIELIEKLKGYPVVDRNTVMKLLNCKRDYAYLILQRLEKRGILKKIIKSKYTAIGDIYKIAANLYYPSYISFLTASMLKKATEQIFHTVQVASNYNKKIDFQDYTIELIKIDKDFIFGYENQDGVFIAGNEKLLIDMLNYRNYSGNFSEIIKVVENLEFSKEKILNYLKKISKQSLIKRVGFLLEKHKKVDLSNDFELDNNYVFLDVLTRKQNKANTKWRVKHDN